MNHCRLLNTLNPPTKAKDVNIIGSPTHKSAAYNPQESGAFLKTALSEQKTKKYKGVRTRFFNKLSFLLFIVNKYYHDFSKIKGVRLYYLVAKWGNVNYYLSFLTGYGKTIA